MWQDIISEFLVRVSPQWTLTKLLRVLESLAVFVRRGIFKYVSQLGGESLVMSKRLVKQNGLQIAGMPKKQDKLI